jgi:hypothetical protein
MMETRTRDAIARRAWQPIGHLAPTATRARDGLVLTRHLGADTAPGARCVAAGLYNENGVARWLLPMTGPRKILVVAWAGDQPIAWSILRPPLAGASYWECEYPSIGLLGAFTRPDLRGRGLARACTGWVAESLDEALTDDPGAPLTVRTENRLVPLASPLFRWPVRPRHAEQFPDFDTDLAERHRLRAERIARLGPGDGSLSGPLRWRAA